MAGADRVFLIDDDGKNLGLRATRNALDVYMQDQATDLVDLYLSKELHTVTISADTAVDDTILLFDTTSTVAGNTICLKEDSRFYQGMILSTSASAVKLDTPLDYAYTVAGGCSIREHDMSVDGSQVTQEFILQPNSGTEWDIVRLMFYVEDDAAMEDSLFGGAPALVNGVVVRKKDGLYKNYFNIKSNGEFAQRAYDRDYVSKPPAGTGHSMIVRRTFGGQSKNGVVVRLNGTSADQLQVLIQDSNTAAVVHFHCIAQGHVVE